MTRSPVCCIVLVAMAPALAAQPVGRDKFFLRVTNVRPDGVHILPRVNVVPNNERPFGWGGVTVWIGKAGEDIRSVPEEQWLAPLESTPWVDIGQYMLQRGGRSPAFYLAPVLCGILTSPETDGLHALVEVARGRGDGIIRRLEIHRPEVPYSAGRHDYPWRLGYGLWNQEPPFIPTIGLLIPTGDQQPLRIYTLEEALRWQLDVVEEFPDWGRLCDQIVFKTAGRPEVTRALGYNGYPADTVEINLGDEIQLDIEMPEHQQHDRFRKHLQSRGYDPLDFIATDQLERARELPRQEQWDLVYIVPPLPERPKQFYEAANFRYALWHEELSERARQEAARHPGKRILAGANFTPAGSVWPDVRHWISPLRSGQLTLSWTEDWWWAMDEPGFQTYGFLLDALRLAGSYHGAPIQYYIMPFDGQSPDHFRRMHALAMAHGARIINHFHTEDQVLTTWDYIDLMNTPPMYQAIHDVIREIGAVEHRLYPAMPERAEVAILLSRAADTWDTLDIGGAGDLTKATYNVNNHERKAIWLALRQAQVPVDLITDEDVAEGGLAPYRVLYMIGSELLAAAAEPLKDWVRGGGVLYASAGYGLLDEYQRPLDSLKEMYGISGHDLERRVRQIGSRRYLRPTPIIDTLRMCGTGVSLVGRRASRPAAEERERGRLGEGDTGREAGAPGTSDCESPPDLSPPAEWEGLELAGPCYRGTLQPAGSGQPAGRYASDGSVGAVMNTYGRGRTLCVGVLAGLAWLKPAVVDEASILPTEFSEQVREFIVTPVRWAGVVPPIAASDPCVETQYMTGPQGDIAVVINFRPEPIDDLVVRFPGKKAVTSVKSLRRAGHFKGHLHEQTAGAVPVEVVDGVPQVRLRLEISDYLLINR